ncbi:RHS repeat domain-containing protein [Alishewanella jeotgali]|uniref:RHS repeat domain-containing protein n=1 Tax=Alishewanella jeotgali TaxID=545533 RepID=UPI003B437FCC
MWRAELKAFPRRALFSSISDFNIGFPRQYWDAEKQSRYKYFRDSDAMTRRYLQSDPIGLASGLNTYGCVGGNPITFIDPLGLAQVWCRPLFGLNSQLGLLRHDQLFYIA